HAKLQSRIVFDQMLAGGVLGPTSNQVRMPLDSPSVTVGPSGSLDVVIPLRAPGAPFANDHLDAREPGVYPLEVDLRDGAEPVSGFTTFFVVAFPSGGCADLGIPLDVAWVWPLQADPALRPDGSPDPAAVDAFKPDGRLGRQVVALGADQNA